MRSLAGTKAGTLGVEVDGAIAILRNDEISPIDDLVGALNVVDHALPEGSSWDGLSVNTVKRSLRHFFCGPSTRARLALDDKCCVGAEGGKMR